MSQEIDYLLLMSDEEIDYSRLSENELEQLALEIEPYIANSALTELWVRKSVKVIEVAWKILLDSKDEHLQATALKIIFDRDRERALDYMVEHIPNTNSHLLNVMLELILYETDFRFELQIAKAIKDRIKHMDSKITQLDTNSIEDFKKVLGIS